MNIDKRLCDLADSFPYGKFLLAIMSFLPFWGVFGIKIATLAFGSLVLHEVGHAYGARLRNVDVKGVYILPRFNGLCLVNKRRTWESQLVISVFGPLCDFTASSTMFVLGMYNDSKVLLFGSFVICIRLMDDLIPQGRNDAKTIWEIVKRPFRVSKLSFWKRGIAVAVCVSMLFFSVFVFVKVGRILPLRELYQTMAYLVLRVVCSDKYLGRLL